MRPRVRVRGEAQGEGEGEGEGTWGSLRMVCWMYCCTARVESISSKGSSGHWQNPWVLVPGRFLRTTVPPAAWPSGSLVIITVIRRLKHCTQVKR